MALREIFYSEALAPTTHNSPSTFKTHDSVNYTGVAGVKYLCLWSAMCNLDGTATYLDAELAWGGGGATVANKIKPHDSTNYQSVFGMIYNDFDTTGGTVSFGAVHKPGSSGRISTMRDSRLLVLETLADDVIYQDSTAKTTSSTTFVDKGSIILNPASSEDYLIVAMGFVGIDTGSRPITIRMYDGTTGYRQQKMRITTTTERHGYASVFRLSGISSSTTISLQIKVDNAADVGEVKEVVILALPLSTFATTYYVEELTRQTTASSTYVTELSNTQTPNAESHILFSSAIVDAGSANMSNDHIFTDGGVTKINGVVEPQVGLGNDDASFFFCGRETYAASSRTWTLQQKRIGSGFPRIGMDDMGIAVLEEGVTATTRIVKLDGVVRASKIVLTG